MLRLHSVRIRNFVGFVDNGGANADGVRIDFSIDPAQPLTVIRAQNESGKTTFLRALRWAFYGEKGIPKGEPDKPWGLQPRDWTPKDGPVETAVSITFSTDGATVRSDAPVERRYTLTRRVRTVPAIKSSQGWSRVQEVRELVRHSEVGDDQVIGDADELISNLLPYRLRDFYFTDGDKAMDYVGGKSADRADDDTVMLSVTQQREQISEAVNDLLGLEILLLATERLDKHVIKKLQNEISAESGSEMVKLLQKEVDEAEAKLDKKLDELKKLSASHAALEADLQKTEAEINRTLAGIANYAALAAERKQIQQGKKTAEDEHTQLTKALGELLGDTSLSIALASPALKAVFDVLKPKFDKGEIPAYYLEYVRRLLKEEKCVCGSSLAYGSPLRNQVEHRVTESAKVADRDTHLGYVYQDAQRLLSTLERPSGWAKRAEDLVRKRRLTQKHIEHCATRLADIESQTKGVKDDALEGLRKHSSSLQGYIAKNEQDQKNAKAVIEELRVQLDGDKGQGVEGLRKRLQAAQHKATIDKSKERGLAAANDILAVMRTSYDHIASHDVARLGSTMNELFGEMIVASTDRNLAEVAVLKHGKEYEIVVRDANGQAVPMSAINGAARRALTMAFVVGLSQVAETDAPNVVDTPLGMSAGVVRRGLFGVTVKHSSQPILLLTRDEIHNVEDLVTQYAGKYYTLTGQWHAPEWGQVHNGSQQVINRVSPRRETLVCTCTHEEYCNVCERAEDLGTFPKPMPLRRKI